MNRPRIAALVGVATLAFALVAVLAPVTVPLPGGDFVVPVVGALALIEALRVVRARWRADPVEAAMPAPERPVATPSPGAAFEEVLAGFREDGRVYYRQSRIREGLRTAAVAVLVEYGGVDEAAARERLATGEWTDDARAAAFLAGEGVPVPSLRDRVVDRVRAESSFGRGVRRTVDAIAAAAGLDVDPGSSDCAGPGPARDAGSERSGDRGRFRGDPAPDAGTDRRAEWAADGGLPECHDTGHWRGVSAVALVGLGVGVLTGQPAAALAGV
ncbi:MAG: DUF58 domain-containing protein, partial [Haloarculaceae archaeon]